MTCPMLVITSTQNPTMKLIRSLGEKKHRQEAGLFVAEGWDMLNRARAEGWEPVHYVTTEPLAAWGATQAIIVTEKIMAGLSSQNNPHPVLATFAQHFGETVEPTGTWIMLEDMRDPGNLGTIIRTADAAGAAGVILVDQSCDPFGKDCIRATTGSIFAVPLVRLDLNAAIALCQSWPGDVVGTSGTADDDYRRAYQSPTLLVMGSEGLGLSQDLGNACKSLVRIPMQGRAESLNVATASALMLYEVGRQFRIS
jgi:RNA methyltransferase, TrmH family